MGRQVMERRLRISHVLVQPVLVWDDGDELQPGPQVEPVTLPLSQLAELAENLPPQVAELAERLKAPGVCPSAPT
jgi:hypothetical protein